MDTTGFTSKPIGLGSKNLTNQIPGTEKLTNQIVVAKKLTNQISLSSTEKLTNQGPGIDHTKYL